MALFKIKVENSEETTKSTVDFVKKVLSKKFLIKDQTEDDNISVLFYLGESSDPTQFASSPNRVAEMTENELYDSQEPDCIFLEVYNMDALNFIIGFLGSRLTGVTECQECGRIYQDEQQVNWEENERMWICKECVNEDTDHRVFSLI